MNREINIPIYRAEVENIGKMLNCQVKILTEIDGKFYAIGFASLLDGEFGITTLNGFYYECKINTRSIHFEDMIASDSDRLLPSGEKDLRIFASLSVDGKGGDRIEYSFIDGESIGYLVFKSGGVGFKEEGEHIYKLNVSQEKDNIKLIGIKQ